MQTATKIVIGGMVTALVQSNLDTAHKDCRFQETEEPTPWKRLASTSSSLGPCHPTVRWSRSICHPDDEEQQTLRCRPWFHTPTSTATVVKTGRTASRDSSPLTHVLRTERIDTERDVRMTVAASKAFPLKGRHHFDPWNSFVLQLNVSKSNHGDLADGD